ncbi:hypothetical protein EVAR_71238_1 [Eumeta japonica]|uniref:Uncharacterized protein n=1 Tax=Eumeta variegata TaxID=151549 RepID=A0A4C1SAP9_EUMVA|nr:hypothetical protein EVAR_71238_1 [Eumeta japonica]
MNELKRPSGLAAPRTRRPPRPPTAAAAARARGKPTPAEPPLQALSFLSRRFNDSLLSPEARPTAAVGRRSLDYLHLDTIGNGDATSMVEPVTAGEERSATGDHELDVAAWGGLPLDELTTCLSFTNFTLPIGSSCNTKTCLHTTRKWDDESTPIRVQLTLSVESESPVERLTYDI